MHAAVIALGLLAAQASATDTLKARDAEIRKALPAGKDDVIPEAKKAKLAGILTQAVDMQAMAKDALGKRWDALKANDRQRYTKAFEAFFRKASEGEVASFRDSQITYGNETPNGDGLDVPTTLTIKGEPTPVVYRLRKEAAGYKIVDITVDGVSTVDNYKSSFGREIDKNGVSGLVAKLNDRAKKPADAKD
jgi:phospholipid transport system substrate-binding protein